MSEINCEDCLGTYRPYRYGISLLRVLMYGFSDWWEFEEEWVIEEQFREHWRDRNVQKLIINKMRTYSMDDSFEEDFNFYYRFLENKRRERISATFLCFDCEKYYCTTCLSKHSGHFTFSRDDKYDISKWRRISAEMLDRLIGEGDQKRENMKREQTFFCDVVDWRCEHDKTDLRYGLYFLVKRDDYRLGLWDLNSLANSCINVQHVHSLHILNDNKNWVAADDINNCIKIFNVNDNKMTRLIKLSSSPHNITEIPSTDPSLSLIAVSFPREKQIHMMNIHTTPAQVVSCINVQGRCHDLDYYNNKLITMCRDFLDGERCDSIHVMNMSGEIINIIYLNKLSSVKLEWLYCSMSVHSESETIYLRHWTDPSCVISLSLDGQVLHSVTFTDLKPVLVHVDKDQNVYVMGHQLPIYKLSSDLRHKDKIIDKNVVKTPTIITTMKFHNDKFYLASDEGFVYIIQHE